MQNVYKNLLKILRANLLKFYVSLNFDNIFSVVTENQAVQNWWPTVYAFVVDRFRAVRQDMTVQELPSTESCILLEKMIPSYLKFPYMWEFYIFGQMR